MQRYVFHPHGSVKHQSAQLILRQIYNRDICIESIDDLEAKAGRIDESSASPTLQAL